MPHTMRPEHRSDRLLQAQGMVSVQLGCSLDDALMAMAERAWVGRVALEDVAAAVVDRRIRFDR